MAEIAEASQTYNEWVDKQATIARKMYQLKGVIDLLSDNNSPVIEGCPQEVILTNLNATYTFFEEQLDGECKRLLRQWPDTKRAYKEEFLFIKSAIKRSNNPYFTNHFRN